MKASIKGKSQIAQNQLQVDTAPVNNLLGRTGLEKDFLYVAEGKRAFGGEAINMHWNDRLGALEVANVRGRVARTARYTSPLLKCKFPAKEFLPSWNVQLGNYETQGFRIYLRASDEAGKFSLWFFLGEGGSCGNSKALKTEAAGWGKTHIDYLELKRPAIAFQYRVEFACMDAEFDSPAPQLHRVFVHYSGEGKSRGRPEAANLASQKMIRVKVPYRSQLDVEVEALRDHVCCPTCVAMVLQQYGVNKPTLDVCRVAYNARHDMHGIWPNASQAAFQFGCRAWVDRFRSLSDVRAYLETGHAIIASIRVGEGQLRGARYGKSSGHLIVITGMKKNKILVNDPYSAGAKGAEIEYEMDDIEKVWLDRGGVAILIEKTKRNGRQKK